MTHEVYLRLLRARLQIERQMWLARQDVIRRQLVAMRTAPR